MRKIFKITGVILGVILLVVICFVSYINIDGIPNYKPGNVSLKVEVTPERVAKGQKIASMLCIECHKNNEGILTGKNLNELPKEFGHINSRNITNDKEIGIGSWTDGEIYYLLRTGIAKDGHYIPVYMVKFPLAADEDLKSVIAFLRSNEKIVQANKEEPPASEPSFLVKFLSHVAWKPLPFNSNEIKLPDTSNVIEHGKYLSTAMYGCFMCHSKDFKTMNVTEPEKSEGFFGGGNKMTNKEGKIIVTPNITFDETGIAKYSEEEFIQAVKYGKKRNGEMVKYPMFPHIQLTDGEVKAIYAYLKTVPKIKNDIKL